MSNKRISELLRCALTDHELIELARKSGQAQRQRLELLNQKAEAMKEYGGRIAAQDTLLQRYAELINQGYQVRRVDCELIFDTPKIGQATLVRLDTGEVVGERSMSAEEQQMPLELHAGRGTKEASDGPASE